jgi:hypothetical protein
MNSLNALSIQRLCPIFDKRLPNHLQELKIIDCKISVTLITQLMHFLIEKSQLKSFTLVNVHHSTDSFDLVIQYLQKSEFLTELDLSWTIIKQSNWLKFLEVLRENRQLVCLTLAFNQLLED